ncbi:RagB/SusD family nutrient uptake outer membrane protein [Pontibacter pudoricolor]|uniref:RagB/SusD family nutrient uptake outer membrane protein n=1 Tax=Pontibacter pudoricolor TaxID=2694930 RepID=UPI0013912ED1|nr:RagB/SusD family nutrient uptake outer membrane protein [Pontibacter pudoricolor]
MKRVLYSAFAACLLLLSSCEKEYLETNPTDQVAESEVFTTTSNGWAAINGMHRAMFFQYDAQDQAGQGSVMINMDMLGEDVVNTTTGNGWWISTYRWLTHRNENAGTVTFVYRFYYKLIANANKIIDNIDKTTGPEADKQAIKGQALAYRAWAHHQLVQIFAERYKAGETNSQLGVPVMLTNTIEGQPRETVEDVYAQINSDFDAAISLLPATRSAKSHINVNVAKGMKARVALTMGKWAEAAQLANEARAGATLENFTQMLSGFNDISTPGWIWGSDQIQDQTTYFYSFFAYMSVNFSSTNIRGNPKAINSKLYANISDTDVRKQLWDTTPVAIKDAAGKTVGYDINGVQILPTFTPKAYMNRKFISAGGSGSSIGDVPYMRAAEMYLIEAEALARQGKDDLAAKALYDLVVTRDPDYVISTSTGQTLIDEILIQRRIELWGEGFRFLDLKRTNSALDRTGANHVATVVADLYTVPAGDKQWQWLLPKRELDTNPAAVQNPL